MGINVYVEKLVKQIAGIDGLVEPGEKGAYAGSAPENFCVSGKYCFRGGVVGNCLAEIIFTRFCLLLLNELYCSRLVNLLECFCCSFLM